MPRHRRTARTPEMIQSLKSKVMGGKVGKSKRHAKKGKERKAFLCNGTMKRLGQRAGIQSMRRSAYDEIRSEGKDFIRRILVLSTHFLPAGRVRIAPIYIKRALAHNGTPYYGA